MYLRRREIARFTKTENNNILHQLSYVKYNMVEMDTLEDLKGLIEYDICLYDKKTVFQNRQNIDMGLIR